MRTSGVLLLAGSLVFLFIDRSTGLLSDVLGKLFCRGEYLQPVNGVVGDGSCGFNADMYLAAALGLSGLAGLFLLVLSYRKSDTP